MQGDKKAQLEKALKGARQAFWLNLSFVAVNLVIFVMLSQLGLPGWIPLGIAGFCSIVAITANISEKAILIELGREGEI